MAPKKWVWKFQRYDAATGVLKEETRTYRNGKRHTFSGEEVQLEKVTFLKGDSEGPC